MSIPYDHNHKKRKKSQIRILLAAGSVDMHQEKAVRRVKMVSGVDMPSLASHLDNVDVCQLLGRCDNHGACGKDAGGGCILSQGLKG
jgi:hypothetical protein